MFNFLGLGRKKSKEPSKSSNKRHPTNRKSIGQIEKNLKYSSRRNRNRPD